MKIIMYPEKESWTDLCRRPEIARNDLENTVKGIIERVKSEGDKAVYSYSGKFDGISTGDLKVKSLEITDSASKIPQELKDAIALAARNIKSFHASQLLAEPLTETVSGVKCWRKNVAIEKVGLYIPGGSAPLFSTLLMLGIPAKLAGCKEITVCTPPQKDGTISPLILYAGHLIGITQIFKVGGAQAIAAMAFGTETIPKVYKIFGPGNQYVTKAKELVQQDGIAIDLPAGPSEVLVIADKNASPEFIAADLISQAEHGTDSEVIMLTTDKDVLDKVILELDKQLEWLPRREIALKALENSMLILLKTTEECYEFSNVYAPEHLIINTENPSSAIEKIKNAGSVFLGKYSCESAGDYASGTNHTLPTKGFAKNYSGVSADSFIRKISFQEISAEGIKNIGPAIELMAEGESLFGHRNAVSVRLKSLENDRN
jgi:histidinol dehydrogenase